MSLLFGIFDQNNNYELLRYSSEEQISRTYIETDPTSKNQIEVKEVCISDVDYNVNYIGVSYDPGSGLFQLEAEPIS